jgi:hypothetical protein
VRLFKKDAAEDNFWVCDEWLVLLDAEKIEYFTGIGHRKMRPPKYIHETTFKAMKAGRCHSIEDMGKCSMHVAPSVDDVLCSLVMDSSAIDQTFDDWCGDYGYDTDSRKALDTYLACQESGKKLQRLHIDIEKAREAFQDY